MIEKRKNVESIEDDIIEKFKSNIDSITDKYPIDKDNPEDEIALKQTITKIIKKYSQIEQITPEHALTGICLLFQIGSYLKSVTNRKIKVGQTEFTKKNLLFATEQSDNKFTLRKIAKYLRQTIADISYRYSVPGHLYARYRIENINEINQNTPEQNKQLATYCTDFQLDNPNTPEKIQQYLSSREKNRNYKTNK